jgi:hypothetical protein
MVVREEESARASEASDCYPEAAGPRHVVGRDDTSIEVLVGPCRAQVASMTTTGVSRTE